MKKCKRCPRSFKPGSGTAGYCSKACYLEAKKERQKIIDDLIKPLRKGLYSNYKIFSEVLPASGQISLAYPQALRKGFDEFAFYKCAKDKQDITWYAVDSYYFRIDSNEPDKTVIIYKR